MCRELVEIGFVFDDGVVFNRRSNSHVVPKIFWVLIYAYDGAASEDEDFVSTSELSRNDEIEPHVRTDNGVRRNLKIHSMARNVLGFAVQHVTRVFGNQIHLNGKSQIVAFFSAAFR